MCRAIPCGRSCGRTRPTSPMSASSSRCRGSGPVAEQLEQFLSANAGKPSRERLTLIRIFEELRGLGYEGGYDAVRRFAKTWSQNRGAVTAEAYVPLYYAPGEAYQFDWSHEVVLISGVTVTVKVAHVRLCHSRMMFARAYMRESQEMVFDAHDRAFAFFRGACTRGIYDNMKTAVEAVFTGKERQYNRRFPADVQPLSGPARRLHPGLGLGEGPGREPGWAGARAVLHAPPAGQEPGRAERLAARQMRGLCQGAPPPRSRPTRRSGRCSRPSGRIWCPMPGRSTASTACPPRCRRPARCGSTTTNTRCLATAVGRPVDVHAYADRIVIRQDGVIVGEHARAFGRGQTIYDPWHYVPVLARKPGALRNGAPFKDWVLPPPWPRSGAS